MRSGVLTSFSRKITYVFIFCGMFLCYLIVSMRQSTIDAAGTQYNVAPRVQMQVPEVILKKPLEPPSLIVPPAWDNFRKDGPEPVKPQDQDKSPPLQETSTEGSVESTTTQDYDEFIQEVLKNEESQDKTMSLQQLLADQAQDKTRALQDLLNEQNRDAPQGAMQAQPNTGVDRAIDRDTEDEEDAEYPRGEAETADLELEVLKETNVSTILFKDFKCGNPNAKQMWCTVDPPEDVLKIKLPPFLKDYKNPCWKVTTPGAPPIRCLPYFFLIGAPKSGTTDLFERMIQHPQISSLVKKEIHWFSRRRYAPRDSKGLPQTPMFVNYTDLFKTADQDLYNNVDSNGYHDKIFGDSSVSTLWDNMNAVRYSILSNTQVPRTAECIHHLNPNTKFVSIIRDPVERTYSDFLYFGNFPDKSKSGFHDAVKTAINFHTECLKHYSLQDCIDYRTNNQSRARLWVGIYHHHFQEYFKYFNKDRFIILKLEDYSANMQENLAKVFSFLGLDPLSDEKMAVVSDQSSIFNTRPSSGVKLGDMWPETRMLLDDYFRAYNDQLGKLLGHYYNYNNKDKK